MRRKLGMLGALVFAVVFFVANGMAQRDVHNKMTVNVPYNFQAGDKTWPPGDYSFIVDPAEHRVQMIQSATSDSVFLTGTPSNTGTSQPGVQAENASASSVTENEAEKYYIRWETPTTCKNSKAVTTPLNSGRRKKAAMRLRSKREETIPGRRTKRRYTGAVARHFVLIFRSFLPSHPRSIPICPV